MTTSPPPLINEYFELSKKYKLEYGEKTVLLMMVGSFYEIYGFSKIIDATMNEICSFCNLNISDKKICVGANTVVMAGFRDYTLDKYLPKLMENGYTAVVYDQEKRADKSIHRFKSAVYSPGTYISGETDILPQISNNIMCVWVHIHKQKFVFGVSVVNIFTGETFIFEHEGVFDMNPTTFDELQRCVSVFSPNEIIFISPFENNTTQTILQYCGIQTKTHILNTNDTENVKLQNCQKQVFISHIISRFFGNESFQICTEFSQYEFATQSLCYLLNFIQEHNPDLVRKIIPPKFKNSSNRVILANHTLSQLNIIDDNKTSGHLSSVYTFLNKCITPMGKRKFQYQITNPTFNCDWLRTEYSMIDNLLQIQKKTPHHILLENLRNLLTGIRDIDKNCRQLIMRKLYPSSVFNLYQSIQTTIHLQEQLNQYPIFNNYLTKTPIQPLQITQFIQKHLILEKCKTIHSLSNFDENFICSGVSEKLDALLDNQTRDLQILQDIKNTLNQFIKKNIKKQDETEYIKIHETEKSGKSLQITKKRGSLLKQILATTPIKLCAIELTDKDIHFSGASSTTDEITFPFLTKLLQDIRHRNDIQNEMIMEVYGDFLKLLETNWFIDIENISHYIAKLDVLQSKSFFADKYKYCQPTITKENAGGTSFFRAKDIRHVLIEHINTNELYVANDISLGENENGMLLFGTNAVGKTSLIRAIGITIILAQSGMYVPCSEFVYSPYTAIYSRILSNDNLFKGLSTFAVEMSELRTILKMADANSLILGDELASGTENESALSIFAAALIDLNTKNSTYMFATHFHDIAKFDEISNMSKLCLKHLTVYYDRELDALVYDRKLKDGSGSRIYGLEVCLSLHLPDAFMDCAYTIRNKYFPETRGELAFQSSKYNSKKIRGICEVCNETIATEIHHLIPQKDADETGHIGFVHKNHKANLASVCEKCHLEFHNKYIVPNSDVKKVIKKKIIKKTKK